MSMHIKISESTAKYALLPGDPGRCTEIAEYLDNPRHLTFNREYNSYSGFIEGEEVIVCSTGIGGPSAAIAVEELSAIGVSTMIRVGTCGAMQQNIKSGDIIIASAACRFDGTSLQYAPLEFPAVADMEITTALAGSAKDLELDYHVGVVHSKDSFYGQHDPDSMPIAAELKRNWKAMIKLGVLASEMECSTLFTVGAARKIKCGAVLTALWNQETGGGMKQGVTVTSEKAIQCAINALKTIITSKE